MNPLQYKNITQPYMIEALYLADSQDEHIVDDVISIWTGIFPCNWDSIPASHDERGAYVDNKLMFASSTSRNELGATDKKKNGTRWISAEELLRHPERWLLLISPKMKAFDIKVEIKRANSLLDRLYDLVGVVLDFVRPGILFNNRVKIYCSKFCHYMQFGKYKRISPRQRYKLLKQLGYEQITVEDALAMQGVTYHEML